MKKLIPILLTCFISSAITAQTISITFDVANKNRNYLAVLDGASYYSNSNINTGSSTNVNNTITLNNIQPGSHTLALYRVRNNNSPNNNGNSNNSTNGNALYSNTFQLRQGYDMNISVKGNGEVSFSEKRLRNRNNNGYGQARTPLTDADFNKLSQAIRTQWNQTSKVNTEKNAFNTAAVYFTTAQVRELLLLIRTESSRLELAKLAYPKATDPNNFTQLYDVFSSVSSRNDLNTYISNNPNNYGGNNGNNNNQQYGNKTAMQDYQFNQLLQSVNGQYQQSARFKMESDVFNNTGNYFSISQTRQLLQLITAEYDRLALAKLSYARSTDAANFASSLSDLFSQSARDELNNYVRYGNTGNNANPPVRKFAMSDAEFNQLYQKAGNHFFPNDKVNDVRNAFNNSSYYFSTSQVRSLLSLAASETDRLSLAKLAWSKVSDPANFSSLYDLFNSQSNRNDLNNYILANGGTNTGYGNTQYNNTRVAMGDAAYNQLLQKAGNHFLPWDKVRDVREAFNNPANYFSTYQIRQLLSLISSESDKLDLAKLSWRTVSDPANFTQLSDLFENQSSRDDLNSYVSAHPF